MRTYYDIGLNLFVRSFHDPEKIIADAEAAGVCCILTGAQPDDNEKWIPLSAPTMYTVLQVSIPM